MSALWSSVIVVSFSKSVSQITFTLGTHLSRNPPEIRAVHRQTVRTGENKIKIRNLDAHSYR